MGNVTTRSARRVAQRVQIKKRLIIGLIALIILSLISVVGLKAWSFLEGIYDHNAVIPIDKPNEDEPINFLLVGVDQLPGRSDTMIFCSYNPSKDKILLLSIPRDTLAYIPGTSSITGNPYGNQKINHAHAYGGLPKAVETVEQFLGVNIHYYARINYNAMHEIVDAIGGVPLDVACDMNYDDDASGLHIHLKQGYQILDGDKAEQYVRWRQNNDHTGDGLGDIGRIQRQQKFIQAAIDQLLKVNNLFKINQLQKIVEDHIATNMDPGTMVTLFKDVVVGFNMEEDLIMSKVPGEYSSGMGAAYWIVQEEHRLELDEMLQTHLAPVIENQINIQVLNGTGKSGLASAVAAELELHPHFSVSAANADTQDHPVTEVISRTDDEIAKYIASIVHAEHNIYKADSQEGPDVIIILGRDYIK